MLIGGWSLPLVGSGWWRVIVDGQCVVGVVYDDHRCGLSVPPLLVAMSPINRKGEGSWVAHLWDSDDEMCCHHLDDMSCPLICQVICKLCYLWLPLVHYAWPLVLM